MKDIVITQTRIKKEFLILIGCFIVAFITNVVSIVVYRTSWVEIFTQIGYVIVIALVLYFLLLLIRILLYGIKNFLKSK